MKTRKAKKTSTVILTLTGTVVLVTLIIIGIIMWTKPKQKGIDVAQDKTEIQKRPPFHENGWDSNIVAEIKDGVPIPVGFQYLSGEKDTGLMVQNEADGKMYVWIPFEETQINDKEKQEKIEEYFGGKEGIYTNPDRLGEIQKYGGFYAGIGYLQWEANEDGSEEKSVLENNGTSYSIASLSLEEYAQTQKQIEQGNADKTAVSQSIMGKEELSMIMDFNEKKAKQENTTPISTMLLNEKPKQDLVEVFARPEQLKQDDTTPISKYSDWVGKTVYAKSATYGYTGFDNPSSDLKISIDIGTPAAILSLKRVQGINYAYCQAYNNRKLYIPLPALTTEKVKSPSGIVYFMGGQTRWSLYPVDIYTRTGSNSIHRLRNEILPGDSQVKVFSVFESNGSKWADAVSEAVPGIYLILPYDDLYMTTNWNNASGERWTTQDTSIYKIPKYGNVYRNVPKGTKIQLNRRNLVW